MAIPNLQPPFFWLEICLILNIFSIAFNKQEMRKSLLQRTCKWNKQLKGITTCIFISYLISQRFKGYRCKSGIVIFALRVTSNYAYSPFNWLKYFPVKLLSKSETRRPLSILKIMLQGCQNLCFTIYEFIVKRKFFNYSIYHAVQRMQYQFIL